MTYTYKQKRDKAFTNSALPWWRFNFLHYSLSVEQRGDSTKKRMTFLRAKKNAKKKRGKKRRKKRRKKKSIKAGAIDQAGAH